MADISSLGPIEQLTWRATTILQPAFAIFPNHDAAGNVLGIPVYSFYAETVQAWPTIICRMHPSAHRHSAIGNLSAYIPSDDPANSAPPGTISETIIDMGAVLELRLGARSEVERERMMDWAYRALMYHLPLPDGSPSPMDQLGIYGINILGLAQPPVLPDMDPSAPRPQGVPPWPGQLMFACQAEYTLTFMPEATVLDVVPATTTVTALT